ncbi:MAG: hypothetical protein JNJ80_07275 [Gemmatimonadetes bacterium]|nr:hypothetical protein [Gemmatimonadota bacterium]
MTDRSAGMSLLSRIAVIGGAVTCFLGAFELTARVEDLVQYGVPIRSPFNATSELLVRSADGMHGRRSAAFQKWRMNSLGFRGPEVDSAKAPGRLRVITAGASETFGLYEAPGKEWPRQLEDSLRRRLAGSACGRDGVEVWNAAFAGMSLPTIRQDIERRLVRFSPDVIVVYPSPAFYLMAKLPDTARPDSSGTEAVPPIWSPRVWPRVRDQLKTLVPEVLASRLRQRRIDRVKRQAQVEFSAVPADRSDAFVAELQRIGRAIEAVGAVPVLATHGNDFGFGTPRPPSKAQMIAWQRFHPLASGPVLVEFDAVARAGTLALGDSLGWRVADVATAVAASPEPVFADYAHFNDHGAAIAAGVVANEVIAAVGDRCR